MVYAGMRESQGGLSRGLPEHAVLVAENLWTTYGKSHLRLGSRSLWSAVCYTS